MKVLVVESNAGQQNALCESLQRQNYCVERVSNGHEAITRAARELFDLVILDLMQPTESSLLVLHEIRELNRESEILILSSPEQISDRVTALIQGADDYLVKPFTCEDLEARILALAKRRSNRKNALPGSLPRYTQSLQTHHLIEGLLHLCQRDNPAIELVISETKLSDLLEEVISYLQNAATDKGIIIRRPQHKLPTLLLDARWMEHMLVNLLGLAIAKSPANSTLSFEFISRFEAGELILESSLSLAVNAGDIDKLLHCLAGPPARVSKQPVDSLALARFCADCHKLNLQGCVTDQNRLQFRISNIRVT